ncbi:hypothetical protein [Streptomyces sp. YIM 98790]|uniref:hypothetical protein n=1 Tax=Streptomyces sp. YIM 98790 TaxID=2689077 RepID=UPI001408F6C7|nr:hypothetical protein [Streptomyces sp. YIM 98790]
MTDARHILVLPDRDTAEEAAEEVAELLDLEEWPPVVREALAGDDDAEDAQWVIVVEDPGGRHDADRLRALAEEYDGWLERD